MCTDVPCQCCDVPVVPTIIIQGAQYLLPLREATDASAHLVVYLWDSLFFLQNMVSIPMALLQSVIRILEYRIQ
jgi:hypothetical protein